MDWMVGCGEKEQAMNDLYQEVRDNWNDWAREEMLRRRLKTLRIFGMPVEFDDSMPEGYIELRPFENPNESIVYDSKSAIARKYINRYLFSEEGVMRINTQRLSRDYRDEQFKRYKESGSMLALYAAATHAKMLNEWPEGLAEALNAEVDKMKKENERNPT